VANRVAAGGDAGARCAERYLELRAELAESGLDPAEIARSASYSVVEDSVTDDSVVEDSVVDDSVPADRRATLVPSAFAPTGVALGAPMPGDHGHRLRQAAVEFANAVADEYASTGPVFAFVPTPMLHVTVVNRSHFHDTAEVTSLAPAEHEAAAAVVRHTVHRPIVVRFRGLILTTGGRLIVPGYPADDGLFRLRRRLVEAVPQLGGRTPVTSHVKLGHLLARPTDRALERLTAWLRDADARLAVDVTFADLYSPLGRIPISGVG
jgi:hypothetical protein